MIRKATQDDVPQIVEMVGHFINSTTYASWLRFIPSAITELAARVIEIGVVFVADDNGRLVGLICGFPMIEPVGKQKMLDELVWWVEPTYRGSRTVGPKLLRAFENWAQQKGLRFVKMVAPSGTDVGAFYERVGYAPVETSYLKRLDINGAALRTRDRGAARDRLQGDPGQEGRAWHADAGAASGARGRT